MIARLVRSCVDNTKVVLAVAAIVMGVGVWHMPQSKVDALPEFAPVTVQVQTEALGLSAEEVEDLITAPLEQDLLNGVAWLAHIHSESVPGLSNIDLTFEPGTDPLKARQVVQERMTQAFALPNVSLPPLMMQPVSSSGRVAMIGISSKTLTPVEIGVLARWTIRPKLIGVPGVANVAVWGQRERQVQVQVNPDQLSAKGITLEEVIRTTGNALLVSPLSFLEASTPGTGGFIDTANQRLGVQHRMPIRDAAGLGQVVVEEADGATQLHDVATVVEGPQPLIGQANVSTGDGIILVVEKLPGANTVEVATAVEDALATLAPGLEGVKVDTTVFRPASYVESRAGQPSQCRPRRCRSRDPRARRDAAQLAARARGRRRDRALLPDCGHGAEPGRSDAQRAGVDRAADDIGRRRQRRGRRRGGDSCRAHATPTTRHPRTLSQPWSPAPPSSRAGP